MWKKSNARDQFKKSRYEIEAIEFITSFLVILLYLPKLSPWEQENNTENSTYRDQI